MLQFLWLGNPENRRCQFFLEAAQKEGFPTPLVLSYKALLNHTIDWETLLPQVDIIRLESFGENAQVAQGLLEWGAPYSSTSIDSSIVSKGNLAGLRQQHLGFLQVLRTVEQQLEAFPAIQLVNSLEYIRLCFDKAHCHAHLQQKGIAVPKALYSIQSYEDLRIQMRQKGWNQVFIKPLHGSSASGVIAFRAKGQQVRASTSVEMQYQNGQLHFFNSLRLRHYKTEQDIALIVNYLAKEGIIVEQWLPKASLGNAVFDLRVIVIGGKCQHVVVRQSKTPLTNLHLGNQRGSLELLIEKIGQTAWLQIQQLAEQTAAVLPPHQYTCLDVLVKAGSNNPYILEANAFGDLLPRVNYQDRNTYAAVLHHLKQVQYAG